MAIKRPRSKQSIPEGETKADRFKRVVTPRIHKAIKAIDVIGYCSGSPYEFTPEQVVQITSALNGAVDQLADKFTAKSKPESEFNFS